VPQLRICRGLQELGGLAVRLGEIRDEVEVLAGGRGDAERLLHEPVGLVPVALRLAIVVVVVAAPARFRRLSRCFPLAAESATPLALHFAVC